jgi:hypothetical protein
MKPDPRRVRLPQAAVTARLLAAGRLVIAAAALAAPVPAVRLLGGDTATAGRVTWLTRMMAIRDAAIGTGALAATRATGPAGPWLLAGAVSDAVDAAVVTAAIRQGRIKGIGSKAVVAVASGAAVAGAVTALRLRRG